MTVGAWQMLGAISRVKNKGDAPCVQGLGNGGDRFFVQSGIQKRNMEGFGFDQSESVHGRSGKPNNTGACLQDCRLQYDGNEELVLNDEDTTVVQQPS